MRYDRQVVLEDVGEAGQAAFQSARVLVVGVGGLGSPISLYLAAAGVGRLGLVDKDTVSLSNLHRQVLYATADVGRSKVEVAKVRIEGINSDVTCVTYADFINGDNALRIAQDYDVIVDASDNFATKYLLNDLAVKLDKPMIYGSILRFAGQASVFWASRGPCLRCLFPLNEGATVPSCAEAGVLGAVAGVIGSLQALEVLKIILQLKGCLPPHHRTLVGRFLSFDGMTLQQRIVNVPKDEDCPVCRLEVDAIQLASPRPDADVGTETILPSDWLEGYAKYRWIDVRETNEWDRGHIPGAAHWALSEILKGARPQRSAGITILYCQGGVRSAKALALLKAEGWDAVCHLPKGFASWVGPVVQDK